MDNLKIHLKTARQLELLIKRRPQAVLLHGKPGVGLHTIANTLAQKLSDKHNVVQIFPDDKNIIKIDVIRQLYGQTRAKRSSQLIVLIDDADKMLVPAQNALLKLLEDTPKGVIFLLTSHFPQIMLPTIRSRLQEYEILPVDAEQTRNILNKNSDLNKTEHAQLFFLGQGLPAELSRLVHNKEYFLLRTQQMREAKAFLNAPLYKKLVIIHKLSNDRSQAYALIQDLMRITETMLKSQADPRQATLLHSLLHTEQKLQSDGHVRIQMMNLAVGTATS